MFDTEMVVLRCPDDTFTLGTTTENLISTSQVLINWLALRACIIAGAEQYLNNHFNNDDRHGQYHGSRGQNRAYWAYRVGRLINDFDTTLVLALVIFGPPTSQNLFDWEIGRSSAFASIIANFSITGEQESSNFSPQVATLNSEVFSPAFLKAVVVASNNYRFAAFGDSGGKSYFDKTKGFRSLLQATLDHMPLNQSNNIKNKVLHLKNIFENTSCENETDDQIIQRITRLKR